ncbi:MAG: hypothetical protein ACKO91_15380 [Acidimicrobiales bacterium]
MPARPERSPEPFVVAGWDWQPDSGELQCRYRLGDWSFTERFTIPPAPGVAPYRAAGAGPGLAAVFDLLAVTAGVSYYKLVASTTIVLDGIAIDDRTAPTWFAYVGDLYDHGLREYCVTNGLPIPFRPEVVAGDHPRAPAVGLAPSAGAGLVVPMGGGRDSLLVAHALAPLRPVLLTVGTKAIVRSQADAFGLPLVELGRRLDPLLFDLNAAGHRNGHVPVTAIVSLAALAYAARAGAARVVLSNEASASRPTRVIGGVEVNHQWSKGIGFERLLRRTLHALGVPVTYGSALRPYGELPISRAVAGALDQLPPFVSCNRAFTRDAAPGSSWCGACAKCCFVFLGLAAFVPERPPLVERFGRDLLATADDIERLAALLLGPERAFDCIGTEAEVAVAVHLAHRGAWSGSAPLGALAARLGEPSPAAVAATLAADATGAPDDDPAAGTLDALLRPLLVPAAAPRGVR